MYIYLVLQRCGVANGRWEVKWDSKGLTCWLTKMDKQHRAANFFAWLSYFCRLVSFCIPPLSVWIKLWVVDSNQEVSRNYPTDVFQNGALPSASTSPTSRRPARPGASDQVGSGRTVTCYLCAAAPTLALSWRVTSPPESEHSLFEHAVFPRLYDSEHFPRVPVSAFVFE